MAGCELHRIGAAGGVPYSFVLNLRHYRQALTNAPCTHGSPCTGPARARPDLDRGVRLRAPRSAAARAGARWDWDWELGERPRFL
eukprot:scaffold118654_cov57-Phaeocystis_antarctica.AAC.1